MPSDWSQGNRHCLWEERRWARKTTTGHKEALDRSPQSLVTVGQLARCQIEQAWFICPQRLSQRETREGLLYYFVIVVHPEQLCFCGFHRTRTTQHPHLEDKGHLSMWGTRFFTRGPHLYQALVSVRHPGHPPSQALYSNTYLKLPSCRVFFLFLLTTFKNKLPFFSSVPFPRTNRLWLLPFFYALEGSLLLPTFATKKR